MSEEGCAICGATWGNYWAEIEGQRTFFCCETCADEFQNMINEVKRRAGWSSIDEMKIEGDRRGRSCIAILGSKRYSFFIRFDSQGRIQEFREES